MGLTSLLSMAVILQIVTDQMPRTSNGMPLLAIYIMFEIFLGAAATLFTVFVIYLHSFWMSNTAVPASLLASTCMRKRKRKISTSTTQTDLSATNLSAPYRKEPKLKICYGDGNEEALDFNINFKDLRMTSVRLRHRWSTSTHRLDLILMSIFIAINCVATGIILAVGNEKLNA
uniref:Neurotransmitter-gated ion-channel transmembrane domain-containing protein n=1 Tax=Plectus sambesii TaxID=2011161 RepID=A0A914WQN7_9BILA